MPCRYPCVEGRSAVAEREYALSLYFPLDRVRHPGVITERVGVRDAAAFEFEFRRDPFVGHLAPGEKKSGTATTRSFDAAYRAHSTVGFWYR